MAKKNATTTSRKSSLVRHKKFDIASLDKAVEQAINPKLLSRIEKLSMRISALGYNGKINMIDLAGTILGDMSKTVEWFMKETSEEIIAEAISTIIVASRLARA